MKKVTVLGAGMVGRAMAIDLAKSYDVTSADISENALKIISTENPKIKTIKANLKSAEEVKSVIKDADIVVCAVPGFMGFQTLKTIIEAGKNVADISFFPENSLELDALAKKHNVTAIVDCGVAPGMDNIILGYYNELMKIDYFECLVGGLPKARKWPFEYKAPFSPIDVIEEYTRAARYKENGHIITREPLTDAEMVYFEKAGTLESFNTDGLRSILFTMPHIPSMKEKTLRFPGHIDLVNALRDSGFFSSEKLNVNGTDVVPLEVTSKILINEWKLKPEEEEFTVMRVTVRGEMNGKKKEVVYDLYDEYDKATKTSSMARTTGYTCTAAVQVIDKNLFSEKGVFPPELVGKHKACFDFFLNHLKERNVIYTKREN